MSSRVARPLVVLAAALVVLAGITVVGSTGPNDDTNPSSRSAGKLGTLAMYTWLQQLGLPVTRVSDNFDLNSADVLVEYDPTVSFTGDDIGRVEQFTQSGGDVILGFGAESVAEVQPLLEAVGVQLDAPIGPGTASPAQPFDVADRVHTVPTDGGVTLGDAPPLVPLLRQSGGVVLGAVAHGAGRMYILGDTGPLSNDGLRHGDSGALVLTLLERARGGRVAFDEYHHGEGSAQTGVAAIFDGPIGLAATLLVVLVLLSVALNGRRLGRPLGGDVAAAPSAATYVDAMGRLFARSRRRGPIAARYATQLKRRIAGATGIDPHLDDDSFVAALAASGSGDADAVGAVLARGRRLAASSPDETSLLRFARDVDSAAAAWPAPR